MYQFTLQQRDYLFEILLKAYVASEKDKGGNEKWNLNTEQREEIGVAVQGWLWTRVELIA